MNEFRGLWRGKNNDGEEWVEGLLIERRNEEGFAEIRASDYWEHEVDPSTLGECTGLRDKNGKLIFEGDILMSVDPNATNEIRHACATGNEWDYIDDGISLCKIYFSNDISVGFGAYSTYPTEGRGILFNSSVSDKIIIGNIHDAPQLLRDKEQALKAYKKVVQNE